MKVLFLDVDGVLNNLNTDEKLGEELGVFQGFDGIDSKLLSRFLNWIKDKDVKIVLSSSWRGHNGLCAHLNSKGIHWISTTPKGTIRGQEIEEWLKSNPGFTHIAILDDIDDMHPLQKYLVHTEPLKGLQDVHIQKLDKLLGYD